MDRLERILTMVYVVQNYWAYFGLYPSIQTMDCFIITQYKKNVGQDLCVRAEF
jgi:hypothetical protein